MGGHRAGPRRRIAHVGFISVDRRHREHAGAIDRLACSVLTFKQRLLTLVMIVLIPLSAVIAYDLVRLFIRLRAEELQSTQESADSAAAGISHFAHQLAGQAQTSGLAIIGARLEPGESDRFLASLGEHVPAEDFAVVGTDGTPIAGTGGGLESLAGSPPFEAAAAGEDLTVAFEPGQASATARIVIMAPIELEGELEAIGMISITPDSLLQAVPRPPEGAALLVTDERGRLVLSVGEDSGLEAGDSLAGVSIVEEALGGGRGFGTDVMLPGGLAEDIGVHVPVPDTGFTAGVYVPANRATQQVLAQGALPAAVVAAVILFAVFASRAYGQRLVRVVDRLSVATDCVAGGDFGTEIPVESHDELGRLAESFHTMQRALERSFEDTGTLAEASQRLNEALEIPSVAGIGLEYGVRLLHSRTAAITVFDVGTASARQVFGYGTAQPERFVEQAQEKVPDAELRDHRYRVALFAPPGSGSSAAQVLVSFALEHEGELLGRADVMSSAEDADQTVFERADVELAATLMSQTAAALGNAGIYEREREIAESMQDSLITPPPLLPRLHLGVEYCPASAGARIGGDFYDMIPIGEDLIAIVIGDISGKGLAAARHTVTGKGAIKSFALDDPEPASVLRRANAVVLEELPSSAFITVAYALIDQGTGLVRYAIAGHPPPYFVDAQGAIRSLEQGEPPLGVVPDLTFSEHSVQLRKGDRLVFYTDGLTEARDADGAFFGDQGVQDTLDRHAHESPQDLARALSRAAEQFADGRLDDDLAAVVVEYAGG